MNSMPPADFGAHGSRQSPQGNAGHYPSPVDAAALAFTGPGSKVGATPTSQMPEQARAGAFEMDESVREFTGNPRDSGGPVCPQNCDNVRPSPSVRYVPGAT